MKVKTRVGIVGGGILGISLGYFLAKKGLLVEIFEASPHLGGLAGQIILEDGTPVDRFYHAILSSDHHLLQLCEELGIEDQLHFRETRMGFYHQGKIHSMNNLRDFVKFPPLGWLDRLRLGITIIYAQFVNDWRQLESVGVEDWLVRLGGRRAYSNIWHPMLKAKFDGSFEQTPATYIWSRLVRMKSTRGGVSQKEEAGHLAGGYISLLEAMVERIVAAGGKIHLSQPVNEIAIDKGKACGIRIENEITPFDAVISTLQTPIFRRLIPDANRDYLDFLNRMKYLSIIAALLVLDRPLTGYWTLNLTDDRFPFTGLIETTSYIDPQYVGGHHLVYLPKYISPKSEWQQLPDEQIKALWLDSLEQMFPEFNRNSVRYFLVHRERYVEPIHRLNETHLIPLIKTPIQNLYLATTAQIYPALTNGESVTRHAREVAKIILDDEPLQ